MRIFDLHCDTLTEIYDKNLSFKNNETAVNSFALQAFKESIIQYAVWFKGDEETKPLIDKNVVMFSDVDFGRNFFDNAEAITAAHAKGAELSIENATDGMTAPFHAGAAKYFAEKGVEVEAK